MSMARITCLCALVMALGGAAGCSDDPAAPRQLPDDVSAPVGEKGGTLKASGLTLEIPAGALDKEVRISVTNAGQSAPKELRAEQLSDVYEFGPEGTKFDKEVKVTFQAKTDDPKAAVYFTKEDGSGFEKIDSEKNGDAFTARVKHFSQGFVGVPLDENDAGANDAGDLDAEPTPQLDAGAEDADPSSDAGDELDAEPVADAGSEPDTQVPVDAAKDAQAQVDAGPALTRIVVHSRDRFGVLVNQTWGAFQDGQGAWQALPAPSSVGVYEFDVTSPGFGVAFVCSTGDFVDSWNTLTYAPSGGAPLEVVTQGPPCSSTPPAVHTLQGTLVLGSDQYWRVGHAHQGGSGINFSTGPISVTVGEMRHNEPNDVLFATGPSNSSHAINRFLVLRDRNLTADVTGAAFDVVKDGVPAAGTVQAQVMNANDATYVDVYYVTRGTGLGLWINSSTTGGSATRQASFNTLPEGARLPGDRYLLVGSDVTQAQWRIASVATYPSGNLNVGLPPVFATTFSAQSAPYLRPVFNFTPVTGASAYMFSLDYSPVRNSNHIFTWDVRPGWLGGSPDAMLTFPDFSQVPGFDTRWVAPGAASVVAKAAVLVDSAAGGLSYKSESGQSATVSAL
jgi:ZU5 domain